jgi:hypothetical protein
MQGFLPALRNEKRSEAATASSDAVGSLCPLRPFSLHLVANIA